MGRISRRELVLAGLVVIALALWIFGDKWINATTVALLVVSLMLVTRVVCWDDMMSNKQAWNTLVWFATLVALADGLNRVGFVKWFAESIAAHMGGFSPTVAMIVLVACSSSPTTCSPASPRTPRPSCRSCSPWARRFPGWTCRVLAMMLVMTLGIMGILTPYATGPSPVYYGSGYIPDADYWWLGCVFGVIYIAALIVVGVPWLALTK